VDFWDYHLYYNSGFPAHADITATWGSSCPWQSSALHKHAVIGEWGNKRTDSNAVSNITGVLDCVNNASGPNGERVMMATYWSCWDIANADTALYVTNGYAYATNGPFSLRTDGVMTVFNSFPEVI
jgi:hypothetical protein